MLSLLLSTLIASTTVFAEDPSQEWRFNVFADGRQLGEHSFTLQNDGDEYLLESKANFNVKILLVNVYRYKHLSRETWRDGCLANIEANTSDNGKRYAVTGKATAQGFELLPVSEEAERQGPCMMTFAYWNPEFLQQTALLNAQTGEVEPVSVEATGEDTLTLGGKPVRCQTYQLTTPDATIKLWYTADGDWVGLHTMLENGRELRYERMVSSR